MYSRMRLDEITARPVWFWNPACSVHSILEAEMNRQKREEAQRNSGTAGKPADQPSRSNPPDREQTRAREDVKRPEQQQPPREPGKLPLPD
jgi:hypothetical protein